MAQCLQKTKSVGEVGPVNQAIRLEEYAGSDDEKPFVSEGDIKPLKGFKHGNNKRDS